MRLTTKPATCYSYVIVYIDAENDHCAYIVIRPDPVSHENKYNK